MAEVLGLVVSVVIMALLAATWSHDYDICRTSHAVIPCVSYYWLGHY